MSEPKKLWLWRNFVNDKPEYWAFDNPYPCASVGGDPLTLGEPCGYAIFKESVNGRPNLSEEAVLLRTTAMAIERARGCSPIEAVGWARIALGLQAE